MYQRAPRAARVSVLYREPKLLKEVKQSIRSPKQPRVSVLYREPKLLKGGVGDPLTTVVVVSVLYREPKLLKVILCAPSRPLDASFSALP